MLGSLLRVLAEAAAVGATIAVETGTLVLDAMGGRNGRAAPSRAGESPPGDRDGGARPGLREAFAALIERSQGPRRDDEEHPAFRTILAQLAPDEARVLRVLAARDTHAAIHVQATPRYGWSSRTVLESFTRLGEEAGCHHPERVSTYLDNLGRLGLVRVYDETGDDPGEYDLLEVHPVVKGAARRIREETGQRATFARRLVRLTALGRAFCDACVA